MDLILWDIIYVILSYKDDRFGKLNFLNECRVVMWFLLRDKVYKHVDYIVVRYYTLYILFPSTNYHIIYPAPISSI